MYLPASKTLLTGCINTVVKLFSLKEKAQKWSLLFGVESLCNKMKRETEFRLKIKNGHVLKLINNETQYKESEKFNEKLLVLSLSFYFIGNH